ncbi:Outer membrane autotransporter barrel [Rhodopseudomonas palustris BisB5]|uniref:Outer membrane autotransporter barrel n=1 Tax=Rhodopseudomonas palustris (strain BisB5) TaxID=316057 RepID=Q13CD8_RHOPS|nr:Outer membrane autotransporter barrel [Rhodopseudomonas palustris BisB5]
MQHARTRILAGFAFAMAASVSTGALAECTGTGSFVPGAVIPGTNFSPSALLPFAAGGAVNSLVSAINTANTAFLTQSTAFVSAPRNPAPNQEGGGVWTRAIGGEVTTKSTSTTSNVSLGGVGLPGSVNCNNENKLSFAGVQVGADTSILNYNGWNMHLGSTVGYLGAKSRDKSSAGALNPLGGTFEDTLQVPFAGVYVAITKGGFFADGQVRLDYYQNSLSDPIVGGIFSQKLDARGLSFTGNVGYNHALENNWFIEPSAGIVVSKVKVDPLNVTGSLVLPATFTPGVTFPGQLQVDDINSTLGRLSLRGGTSIASGNMIWQPFAIASVYHEFSGAVTSTFNGDAAFNATGIPSATGTISSTNLGTYGQFGLGVAGQLVNTGLLGYVRADYRTGDHIDGYSLNGGVRYQFAPDAIVAAPLYTKAAKAPVLVRSAYNWTGFFIGGSFGALNGRTDWTFQPVGTRTDPRFAGAIGGGQIGYDHQFGKWVVGVEGNLFATNANGARPCPNGVFFTCENNVSWMGTATAKLGYAFWDRSLWYVRGGGAFGDLKVTTNCNTGPVVPNPAFLVVAGCGESASRNRAGWTIGFGSEFALSKNWTVRAETNYFDMGRERYTLPTSTIDVKENGFISTVGLNYRFAPTALVAKY